MPDARFGGLGIEPEAMAWLMDQLEPIFRCKTNDHWCAVLAEAGVRHAKVRDYAEVAADPGVWENGYLRETDGERVVGTPIRMSRTPLIPGVKAPELGEHTETTLGNVGYTSQEIDAMREKGCI